MRKWIPMVLLFAVACATAKTPVDLDASREGVRQAEIAFATAFKERDTAKFFSWVAPDATFLGPNRTLHGKEEVTQVWSGFFKDAAPPFSWEPTRVEVNGDGTIGFSYGPVKDPQGNHFANYTSIWRKQPDGSWKVLFDGPGCQVCAK